MVEMYLWCQCAICGGGMFDVWNVCVCGMLGRVCELLVEICLWCDCTMCMWEYMLTCVLCEEWCVSEWLK